MKIEPVGIQRNIQIAYLKGIKKIYLDSCDADELIEVKTNKELPKLKGKWFVQYIPSGKPYKTHSIDSEVLPSWSTNRNDVWELWDELPKSKFYEERDGGQPTLILGAFLVRGTGFADCASQAWILWKKENEKDKQKI